MYFSETRQSVANPLEEIGESSKKGKKGLVMRARCWSARMQGKKKREHAVLLKKVLNTGEKERKGSKGREWVV